MIFWEFITNGDPAGIETVSSLVMLCCNLFADAGWVNGSIGVVKVIIFQKGLKPLDDKPEVVMVKFLDYNGPKLENGCVPISYVTRSYIEKNETVYRRPPI